jgi:hypothetical protein
LSLSLTLSPMNNKQLFFHYPTHWIRNLACKISWFGYNWTRQGSSSLPLSFVPKPFSNTPKSFTSQLKLWMPCMCWDSSILEFLKVKEWVVDLQNLRWWVLLLKVKWLS